jgi:hypothetical protein
MRLAEFFASVVRFLRGRLVQPVIRVVSLSSSQSASMPNLISTFLIGSTNRAHYSLTDGVVRPDKRIDLGDAIKIADQDTIWATRGKAIQGYAMLEQALCMLFADLAGTTHDIALIIFYKITSADSRNKILEKLLHKKHGRKFNLFWNAYFKELHKIDLKRNEIVHWLSAMNAAMNTQDMMIVGIGLIHPASLGQGTPPGTQLVPADLTDFAIKCEIFARLCTMFISATSHAEKMGAGAQPWLDIFQQRLIYPLPAGHLLLNQTQSTPGSQPQSSQA